MSGLTVHDKHHWAPIPQVVSWLSGRIAGGAKVLEIGPGHSRFPRADTFVDFVELPDTKVIKCDIASEPLPFADKSFDFIYARHVLEDMFDPFPICREMSRVGKAGYIETPSPIAELGRGVDGGAPPYRGYHHHRFIAWVHGTELRFVSKYPLIEYLRFDEDGITQTLKSDPKYWNTYYLWSDRIDVVHRQSPLDYDIPRDYQPMLADAVAQSKVSTDAFWAAIPERLEIPSLNQLASNA